MRVAAGGIDRVEEGHPLRDGDLELADPVAVRDAADLLAASGRRGARRRRLVDRVGEGDDPHRGVPGRAHLDGLEGQDRRRRRRIGRRRTGEQPECEGRSGQEREGSAGLQRHGNRRGSRHPSSSTDGGDALAVSGPHRSTCSSSAWIWLWPYEPVCTGPAALIRSPGSGSGCGPQAPADVDRRHPRPRDPLAIDDDEVGVAVAVGVDALDEDDPPFGGAAAGQPRRAVRGRDILAVRGRRALDQRRRGVGPRRAVPAATRDRRERQRYREARSPIVLAMISRWISLVPP